MGITLRLLDGRYAIVQLPPDSPIPAWWDGKGFTALARDDEELSLICQQERVPQDVRADGDWVCLTFVGPFAFDQAGILLSVIRPLSEDGIGIFVTSTFNTDHLMVKAENLGRTLSLLRAAGHVVS
ncbi:ACT domain-containing protein [Nitrospirillum sp. BR 11828]|uniref:ACT domain-containing protein n=1 Tax=Nitrospirillum sp. BR 11828 TaxID=3104325 RepID=UPI002ACA339B|nr:ACT domain-containing protein [Nitrospirillum sp. BR 11828]MDZ5648639.1 ACT domain-containing protein [Nitrospirillum sp. BR 11828]